MAKHHQSKLDKEVYITLPILGKIQVGPGTVPISPYGAKTTDIQKVIKAARRASRLGVFDTPEDTLHAY